MAILERVRRAAAGWFSVEGPAFDLGVVRIVVFAVLFDRLVSGGFSRFVRLPEELRVLPPGFAAVLRVIPADETTVLVAQVAAALCAGFALVGLWTRPMAALATLFATWVLGAPYLFGKVDHTLHHLIWFGALLAASPSGDALSLDAWRARRRGVPAPAPARAYALPIRLMWLLIGVAYFFPGLYKLRAGLDWLAGDHLKLLLWESWRHRGVIPALRVDLVPGVTKLLGAATIAFELSFLFLVIGRRTRPFAALGGLLFHASTAYFMRIWFLELAACYAVFVDWSALRERWFPRAAAAAASRGPRAPEWRPAAWVGGVLLSAQILCGALRIDSWPVSVYPRFDEVRREPVTTQIEVWLENADGSQALRRLPLRSAMLRRIARLPSGPARDQRLRALAQVVAERRGGLAPGDVLRVYRVSYATEPGRWQDPPLRREPLFDYPAAHDVESSAGP